MPGARLAPTRHPELVSGSIARQATSVQVEEWMLKQVQHDEGILAKDATP